MNPPQREPPFDRIASTFEIILGLADLGVCETRANVHSELLSSATKVRTEYR